MAMSSPKVSPHTATHWPRLALVTAIIAFCGITLFRMGIETTRAAWAESEHSHGPLAPIIFVALILHIFARIKTSTIMVGPLWPSLSLVCGALVAAVVADFASLDVLSALSFVVFLFGILCFIVRSKDSYRFVPAFLCLLFAIPLPVDLFWKVQTTLQ